MMNHQKIDRSEYIHWTGLINFSPCNVIQHTESIIINFLDQQNMTLYAAVNTAQFMLSDPSECKT
jgi:hypothetical protein